MTAIKDEYLHLACEAVTHALRPRDHDTIAQLATWPTADRDADIAYILETRQREQLDADRTVPWWEASGADVTAALMVVCDVDEGLGSHLVGVSVQAMILAGRDLVSDSILRLAERAACWIDGREAAAEATS